MAAPQQAQAPPGTALAGGACRAPSPLPTCNIPPQLRLSPPRSPCSPQLGQHVPRQRLAGVPQLLLVQLLQHFCLCEGHKLNASQPRAATATKATGREGWACRCLSCCLSCFQLQARQVEAHTLLARRAQPAILPPRCPGCDGWCRCLSRRRRCSSRPPAAGAAHASSRGSGRRSAADGCAARPLHRGPLVLCCHSCQHFAFEALHNIQACHPVAQLLEGG